MSEQLGTFAGRTVDGARASFGLRFVAALIDGIIVGAASGVLRGILGFNAGSGLGLLLGLGYAIYLEGSPSGQTIGKKVMNIRVVDANDATSIGYGRAAIRYFAKFLSALPCGLGYFWMLWDKDKQTWHDKLSTSIVVPTSAYPVAAWPG